MMMRLLEAMSDRDRVMFQGIMVDLLSNLSDEERVYYSYNDLAGILHEKLRRVRIYRHFSYRYQVELLFELCQEMEGLADDDENLQLYIIDHIAECQSLGLKPLKEEII